MTHTDQPTRRYPPPPQGEPETTPPEPARGKASARRASARRVSPGVARQIDENLKRLYRQQVEQDLPPELEALVAQLRGGGTTDKNGGDAK